MLVDGGMIMVKKEAAGTIPTASVLRVGES